MRFILLFIVSVVLLTACNSRSSQESKEIGQKSTTTTEYSIQYPECVITSPPDSLHLDPFYKKYVCVNGIPLISSWRVPDSCIQQAFKTLYAMTSMLSDDVLESMKRGHARVGIMARYEGTTDIPEHRYLANDTSINWDVRARGMEGTREIPITTCAEENILAYQIDKYHAEDILIHEFAHAIHLIGIAGVDSTFDTRLQALYKKALDAGKLDNVYGADNKEEYWAEGVQDWFNVNAEVEHPDGKHNWVNTREELKEYDPRLYQLISEYLPATSLQISRHPKENIWGPNGRR